MAGLIYKRSEESYNFALSVLRLYVNLISTAVAVIVYRRKSLTLFLFLLKILIKGSC